MEEVSFAWILYTISQGNYFLPVLNTFVFKEEKLFCEYQIHENILMRRIAFESISTSTFLHNLLAKLAIQNKLRRLSEKICCVTTKNSKTFINYKELKELSSSSLPMSKIMLVQLAKPNYFKEIRMFEFKLSFISNAYQSSFYEKKDSLVLCKDKNFYEKAKDIVNLILVYIQKLKNKKILNMTVNFVSDDSFSLWISNIVECGLINYHESYALNLENLIELDVPARKKNLSTDLNHKNKIAAISTPDLSVQSSQQVSDDSFREENEENFMLARKYSISKREIKRKKVETEDNDKFSDFLEILSKTYARFTAETQGKRVSQDDIEREYKRISALLTNETNDNPRKFSQVSINFSSQPNSPSMFRNKSGNGLTSSANNSRKGSEIQVTKTPAYRIRILKTIKD